MSNKKFLVVFTWMTIFFYFLFGSVIKAEAEIYGDFEYSICTESSVSINQYNGNATTLEIPATIDGLTVTGFGDRAFYNCDSIMSVILPEGITAINELTFYGCSNLKNIAVDENNANLCAVDGIVYNKEKSILLYCPEGKTGDIESIPFGVTKIAGDAFTNCRKITTVKIPEGVEAIGSYAFINCSSLENVTLPEGLKTIDWGAFSGCSSLLSMTIPKSVIEIKEDALGMVYDSEKAFYKIMDGFIVYGYTGTAAESYAKQTGCKFVSLDVNHSEENDKKDPVVDNNINRPMIPNPQKTTETSLPAANCIINDIATKNVYTVTVQGATVEYKGTVNKSVKTVSIPSSVKINGITYKVTSIAAGALKNNKKVAKVTVGSNVKIIGKQAFFGCKNLKSIIIKSKKLTEKSIGAKAFSKAGSSNYKKLIVKAPKNKIKEYQKLLKKKGLNSKVKIK